jgi:DNA-binding transcriptional MerR regulator/methylmalonyl-CoA mutase cobalamin-binding subunit
MRQRLYARANAPGVWVEVNVISAIRLSEYATTPLYNIKAVVQATNISPSTLRAWERRYNMCRPERSESGYRLYSDRDIAVIRWLKAQVDAGMSISQATSWLQALTNETTSGETATLPDPSGRIFEAAAPPTRLDVQNFATLQARLLDALLAYDEVSAEQVLANAFALYPIEHVGEHVIVPTMVDIGERWHRGELAITREHYATNYLMQRLSAILRVVPNARSGAALWVGCAPGEQHEMGAMLLSIYLRRAGHQVRYLGQNLQDDDLIAEVRAQQPPLILLSASGLEAATNLQRVCAKLVALEPPRPIIGYGGRIFTEHSELRNESAGVYVGATALEAVESVGALLADTARTLKSPERTAD